LGLRADEVKNGGYHVVRSLMGYASHPVGLLLWYSSEVKEVQRAEHVA